ncbi:hypothetical protein CKK33_02005 [Mucilaginibacter sp. MD40]|uniref:DUF1735 domain-containing protein n=1 Tax=Mucilaginibacter sp. MD40 TaxID=2029590 RepID=UPI000BAC991E|nr:DUF1735 domain-containing protein [Mucilaginibacter sp. MD40]PAW92330.1 hypothetical protein CKK33_02005 [Mucilaginibacter sp. MD40]
MKFFHFSHCLKALLQKFSVSTLSSELLCKAIAAIMPALLFTACVKDSKLDGQLLKLSGSGNTVSYLESGSLVFLNDSAYSHTSGYTAMSVSLSKPAPQADTVLAVIDPSAISEYNTQHGERNPGFPADAFMIAHQGRFPVAAGATVSKDSLFIMLRSGQGLKSSSVYLVPVRLTSRKGNKLSQDLYYFKISIKAAKLTAYIDNATALNGAATSRLDGGAFNFLYFDYPDSLKLSVGLNMPLPGQDVIAEAMTLSASQVDSINQAQYFFSVPLPSYCYQLANSRVTIPGGAGVSKDSLVLKFSNRDSLVQYQYYLMAVKLKHYKASKYGVPPAASDSSVAYIRFFLQ